MKEVFLLSLLISGSLLSIAQEQKITIPMTAKDPKVLSQMVGRSMLLKREI